MDEDYLDDFEDDVVRPPATLKKITPRVRPRPKSIKPLKHADGRVDLSKGQMKEFIQALRTDGFEVVMPYHNESSQYTTLKLRVVSDRFDFTWEIAYNGVLQMYTFVNEDLVSLVDQYFNNQKRTYDKPSQYYIHSPDNFGPVGGNWYDVPRQEGQGDGVG